MRTVKPNQLADLLSTRVGLLIGPGVSLHPGALGDLSSAAASEFGVSEGATYQDTLQSAIAESKSEESVRQFVHTRLAAASGSADLGTLAQVPWRAVLSATLDSHFENRFTEECDRSAVRQKVTVLYQPDQLPPPRTTPVFKLIGSIVRPDFAFSTAKYLVARTKWGRSVQAFTDRVRHGAVLCLGMGDCPWIFHDILAEISARRPSAPSGVFLLADDPLREDPIVESLLGGRSTLVLVDGSLSQFLKVAQETAYAGHQLGLFTDGGGEQFEGFARYSDLAVVVNTQLTPRVSKEEQNRLKDLLFSPASLHWDPFAFNLDLQRTVGESALHKILEALKSKSKLSSDSEAYVLTGSVASGKTTILKRLAFELAKSGQLVLWLRQSAAYASQEALITLFKFAVKHKTCRNRTIVVFMDDPPSFGSLLAAEVAEAAKTADAVLFLVLAARTGDWNGMDRSEFHGPLPVGQVDEISDSLDEVEISAMPDYLLSLNLCADEQESRKKVAEAESRKAQDTLSMLFLLLPRTRSAISNSIRDEYFRLGDATRLAQALFSAASDDSTLLRRAYEMVAVADHFHAPLPIEVVVSALDIDYQVWRDLTAPGGAVWGLIYAEEDEESDTVSYRTRNGVITRVIVETINGGSVGHSGEVRVLADLLSACQGTLPAYREFCARVLVGNRVFKKLDYRDGLRLFGCALDALPCADRTLVHHKGLWVKTRGKDPAQAYKVLEEALNTPVSPSARKGESEAHIHTSLAATALEAIDTKAMSLGQGKAAVLRHLDQARSKVVFDPHLVHVQANLMVRLAGAAGEHTADTLALFARAIADVDRTTLILKNSLVDPRDARQDLEMLGQVKAKVLSQVGNLATLRTRADELWNEFQSQEGMALLGRALFEEAERRGKGSRYRAAFDYCRDQINKVRAAQVSVSATLLEITLQIYYRWQVQRNLFSSTSNEDIRWDLIKTNATELLLTRERNDDVFYRYMRALALAHEGSWTEANAAFSQLRQVCQPRYLLHVPRDMLLHPRGGRRSVQGIMKRGHGERYLHVEELQMDFRIDRKSSWPRDEEIAHASIRFSFAGPTAVKIDD